MPAAAVIPAPIMYIIVVAVKKLVVGLLFGNIRSSCWKGTRCFLNILVENDATLE